MEERQCGFKFSVPNVDHDPEKTTTEVTFGRVHSDGGSCAAGGESGWWTREGGLPARRRFGPEVGDGDRLPGQIVDALEYSNLFNIISSLVRKSSKSQIRE